VLGMATGSIWPPIPTSKPYSTKPWSSERRRCCWLVCRCWTGPAQARSPTSPAGPASCWRRCCRMPRIPGASWSTCPRCWGAPDRSWNARGLPTAVR
jgi:hypothetical protein